MINQASTWPFSQSKGHSVALMPASRRERLRSGTEEGTSYKGQSAYVRYWHETAKKTPCQQNLQKDTDMTAMKAARKKLTTLIETYALDRNLTFTAAAREVTRLQEHHELVLTALGNWWKSEPLTYAMILGLRNRRKQGLVRYFKYLRKEQMLLVQPYLPVRKRIEPDR